MFGRLNRQVRKAGGGGAKLRLQPLEAREVPALNFWIGTSDNYANATFWTDGIPTADDIVILKGIPTPTTPTTQADGETPPPIWTPQPSSPSSVTFPTPGGPHYLPGYAGIRILNGYTGTATFPANVGFAQYTQTAGSTAQAAGTTLSVTSSFSWTGGAVNATSNVATYTLSGATGQIGEDTTNLNSGSKFVLEKNIGGIGATACQAGVLHLLNDSVIEIFEDCLLRQRQITTLPPADNEIVGGVKATGRFLSEGGKATWVKVEPSGSLEVDRNGNKGGFTVTGKVPGTNWGVVSRGSITMRNGETLTADHGVEVTDGGFYTLSGFQVDQVATIDGRFSFEGTEIRLGLLNFMEDGTKLGHTNTTLKVTKRTDLLIGDFKPKLDATNPGLRDVIDTDKAFNCDTAFSIKPEAAAPAAGTLVLVSVEGFMTSLNPVNGDPTNFTMARTADGTSFEVKPN